MNLGSRIDSAVRSIFTLVLHHSVNDIAYPPLEASKGFLLGFALGDLSQEVVSGFRISRSARSITADLTQSDPVYSGVELASASVRFLKPLLFA